MSGLSAGEGGLPLQLTTITVAVPASLDNNLLGGMGGGGSNLLSPVSQQDVDSFKWKYEQTRTEKISSTLVREIFI